MLFHLVAVSIVTMAFMNEAFGKIMTTTTTVYNCSAAMDAVENCLSQPARKKQLATFNYQLEIMDIANVLKTLTKLKKKCFSKPASLWTDITGWVKLNDPPAPLAKIFNSLTKAQKTILEKSENQPNNKALYKKADAIQDILWDKYEKLSDDDMKIVDDWKQKYDDGCGKDSSDNSGDYY